jgi:TPR repeat protein
MRMTGRGGAQDFVEAAKWFRAAADNGNAPAQNNLGWLFSTGQGVAEDREEAIKWFQLAAEQGLSLAQNNLGLVLMARTGEGRNSAAAEGWLKKSAEHGDLRGNVCLRFYTLHRRKESRIIRKPSNGWRSPLPRDSRWRNISSARCPRRDWA